MEDNFLDAVRIVLGIMPAKKEVLVNRKVNVEKSYKLAEHQVHIPINRRIADNYRLGVLGKIREHHTAVATRNGSWVKVEKPGFYTWPTLNRKTGYNFVFFDKPGKYSLANIYKHFNEKMGAGGVISKKIQKRSLNVGGLYTEELRYIFTYPAENIHKLSRRKVWKDVQSDYLKFYEGETPDYFEVEKGINPAVLNRSLLDGRYLPIVSLSNGITVVVNSSGSPQSFTTINGFTISMLNHHLDGLVELTNSPSYSMDFAFDLETDSIVFSEDITEYITKKVNGNRRAWRYYDEVVDKYRIPDKGIVELTNKLNQYFANSGFPSLKASLLESTEVYLNYSPYDYSERGRGNWGTEISKEVSGYSCVISHKGRNIIGKGQVYVRESDDGAGFTLIQSSWCQRISHWSKYKVDVIDQRYDIWPLVDWITGPFAEMREIDFSEAPAIFMGQNRTVSKDKKRNAIKDLKKRLRKGKNNG